jgi:hypothetical protein
MNKIDRKIYDNLDILPEDLQGWNGKSKLFGQLIGEIRPKTIIEVGTWKGQSAINMGTSVVDFNLNTKIFCVDTWLGAIEFLTTLSHTPERNLLLKNGYPQIYYQFLSNVVHHGLEDYILPIPNTSENGFRFLKSSNIMAEMIYIDASHEEDDVYKDICNYYELLSSGVIFGDDYIGWVGVRNAINRFVFEKKLNLEIIENNFWLIRK